MRYPDPLLMQIQDILNDTTTRKVKRALLRALGLAEKSIDELCPLEDASDY